MNKYQLVISLIEDINNFSATYMTEHEEAKEQYIRFINAVEEARLHGLYNEAISYYNFKYLIDLHGENANFFVRSINQYNGTQELSDRLVKMANSSELLDSILAKSAWGRKELLSLPYGKELSEEMVKINKTNLGTKDIVYLLFGIKSKEYGFTYYNEFVDMMKQQKTMINKEVAQQLLKSFWENTRDDYKTNPILFNTIKSIIISLNTYLTNNNSTQQLRIKFMEEFLRITLNDSVKSTP